jgi:hypothetical protein
MSALLAPSRRSWPAALVTAPQASTHSGATAVSASTLGLWLRIGRCPAFAGRSATAAPVRAEWLRRRSSATPCAGTSWRWWNRHRSSGSLAGPSRAEVGVVVHHFLAATGSARGRPANEEQAVVGRHVASIHLRPGSQQPAPSSMSGVAWRARPPQAPVALVITQ